MLKLIDTDIQPAMIGLPASRHEWWDLGEGYEITLSVSKKSCSLNVRYLPSHKDITLEISKYLDIDTSIVYTSSDPKGREIFLYPSIDCVMLNYTKPEKYKELLKRIAEIVDKHFKNK